MAGEPLAELRELISGDERRRIEHLEGRLADPAPWVEDALGNAVRRNPRSLADALFPIMGPAIRKAIAATFAELVQSLNQALEHSLTIRGLSWRLEALRSGKSFAEVVMRHTLLYRVEQVFLIHRDTGLLLQHVMAPAIEGQSPDMVSGMLTAIQDFVRDSFGGGQQSLESLQVGELTVWVEQATGAVLAAVVRGTPPAAFRLQLADALGDVQARFAGTLGSFAGDAAQLDGARPVLETLLQEQLAERAGGRRSRAAAIAAAVVLALLLLWAGFACRSVRRWQRFENALRAEPGIVVAQADRRSFARDRVTGLRDDLAADPAALANRAGLDTGGLVMTWKGYASTDAEILRRRAGRSAESLAVRVESVSVGFALGSSDLTPDDLTRLALVRADLERLVVAARAAGRPSLLTVRGHTDSTGAPEVNAALSRSRAERVAAALALNGLTSADFSFQVEGDTSTSRDRATSLHVTLTAPGREHQPR